MDTSVVVEIHQRLALYGHAADAADRTLLAQVFSTDAIFDADPVEGGKHQGLDAIVQWFELGKPPHPIYHVTTNPFVYEDDGDVHSPSKWLIAYPAQAAPMNGDYLDLWVDTDDGWRISKRVATGRLLDPGFWEETDTD